MREASKQSVGRVSEEQRGDRCQEQNEWRGRTEMQGRRPGGQAVIRFDSPKRAVSGAGCETRYSSRYLPFLKERDVFM